MADGDGAGILFGAFVIAVLAAGGLAARGSDGTTVTSTATVGPAEPVRTTTTTTRTVFSTSDNIPGGALVSCPGWVIGQRTANGITLRVFYSPESGGLNCVSATRNASFDPPSYLSTELRFADYSGGAWPQFAVKNGAPGVETVSGAYLTATDDRCVSATATYHPAQGASRSVSLIRIGCG